MFKAFEFCIPTRGIKVPNSPDWLHEIKVGGFCLARKQAATGRLLLAYRNYHEFARGKPRRTLSSQLSGKLTDATLSAPCAELAAFWPTGLAELAVAFAKRSLSSRFVGTFTALLPRMLGPRPPRSLPSFTLVSESGRPLKGIRNSGPGCLIFDSCPSSRHLHQLIRARRDRPRSFPRGLQHGLEGLVSKRRDRPYRGGPSKDWVKVKNRKHPAMERVKDTFSKPEATEDWSRTRRG